MEELVYQLGLGQLHELVARSIDEEERTCLPLLQSNLRLDAATLHTIISDLKRLHLIRFEQDPNFITIDVEKIQNIMKHLPPSIAASLPTVSVRGSQKIPTVPILQAPPSKTSLSHRLYHGYRNAWKEGRKHNSYKLGQTG